MHLLGDRAIWAAVLDAGIRRVPITALLRHHLLNHRLHQGIGGTGFEFPNSHSEKPFDLSSVNDRAREARETAGLARHLTP